MGGNLLGANRDLPAFAAGMEQWSRLLRTPASFPTPPPPPHSWHLKTSETGNERADRLMDQERDKSRERDSLLKKPLPNSVSGASDKERKESNKSRDVLERFVSSSCSMYLVT